MRTTSSTVQALERLCEAAGWKLTRDGRSFVVHFPRAQEDLTPVGKTSPRALALAVSAARFREDWPELRAATAFDPGWIPAKNGGYILNISDMVSWEEDALQNLAAPYRPDFDPEAE